jgi:hypothetical protein
MRQYIVHCYILELIEGGMLVGVFGWSPLQLRPQRQSLDTMPQELRDKLKLRLHDNAGEDGIWVADALHAETAIAFGKSIGRHHHYKAVVRA